MIDSKKKKKPITQCDGLYLLGPQSRPHPLPQPYPYPRSCPCSEVWTYGTLALGNDTDPIGRD